MNFEVFTPSVNIFDLIDSYNQMDCDFGDHLLHFYSQELKTEYNSIFSYDKDFYNLPDDFYFITTNREVIIRAMAEGKLISNWR